MIFLYVRLDIKFKFYHHNKH